MSQATANLSRRLTELGIDHVYDDYGPGAHTWPYWDAALEATLPAVLALARSGGVERPDVVSHLAYEPAFSVWGHEVVIDRDGLSPVELTISPEGCSLHGEVPAPASITTADGSVIATDVVTT